jgi:glyceraldehyde 3-phosphate dehydrogenase
VLQKQLAWLFLNLKANWMVSLCAFLLLMDLLLTLPLNLKKPTTKEELNAAMKEAAEGPMKGILEYCEDPIVSTDVIGNSHSSVFDSKMTQVIDGTFVKVLSWYDNEFGYSSRVVDLIGKIV